MEGYQLIYSTCKTGITNSGNGFQIYSYSDGIPQAYITHEGIRKICGYKEPVGLPAAPTKKEIEELFPIKFTYSYLDGQSYYVSRNKYTGLDNNGARYGSIISHAICFKDIASYPISAVFSNLFWDDLPESEKNRDTVPDFLPVVQDKLLFDPQRFTLEEIGDFLCEDPDRIVYLRMMIKAVFEYFTNDKKIIICDTPENILMWIAAVTRAFPLYIAKRLSFSTYAYDPLEADTVICGVVADGTAYSVESARSYGIFNIFDFENQYFSDIDYSGNYCDAIETGMTVSNTVIVDFFDYLSETEYNIEKGYTSDLYNSYMLYRGNENNMELSEFRSAFQFVLECDNSSFVNKFLNAVIEKFNDNTDMDTNTAYVYTKYGMLMARKLNSADAAYHIGKAFWDKVLFYVNDYEHIGIENVENLISNVLVLEQNMGEDVLTTLHQREIVDMVSTSLHGDTVVVHNVFWVNLIVGFIMRKKISLHEYAKQYDTGVLRETYCNLQLVKNPKEVIDCVMENQLPIELVYEYYESIMPLFAGGKVYATLYSDLYRRLIEKNHISLLRKFIDSLTAAEVYPVKVNAIEHLIKEQTFSGRDISSLASEDKDFWNTYCVRIIECYINQVQMESPRGSNAKLRDAIMLCLPVLNEASCAQKLLQTYDSTVSVKNEKDFGKLEEFLDVVQECGKNPEDTKAYAVYLINKRLFANKANYKEVLSAMAACRFELLSEAEQVYVVEKMFGLLGKNLVDAQVQKKFLNALDLVDNKWEIYTALVLESTNKDYKIYVSYFELLCDEKWNEGKEVLFDYLSALNVKKLKKIQESTTSLVAQEYWKEYMQFILKAEETAERNKKGVFSKIRDVFARKDN